MRHSTTNGQCGQAFLNGHTTDYHDQHERQRMIVTRVTQLTQDITELMTKVSEYAERYDMPKALVERLHGLGQDLTDGAQAVDPAYLAELVRREAADAWDFRNHYCCEPADYRGGE